MKNYTIKNGYICYGDAQVYALSPQQNAESIRESVEYIHRYLLENADISLLRADTSLFDVCTFSCPAEDLPYILDMFAELNLDLKADPDEEDYFIFEETKNLHPCFGDVLIKWNMETHSYVCYDMGLMDLHTLLKMLR